MLLCSPARVYCITNIPTLQKYGSHLCTFSRWVSFIPFALLIKLVLDDSEQPVVQTDLTNCLHCLCEEYHFSY